MKVILKRKTLIIVFFVVEITIVGISILFLQSQIKKNDIISTSANIPIAVNYRCIPNSIN